MKKFSTRVISMLLAIIMIVGMTGCGDSGNSAAKNAEAKNYVYRLEDIETDLIDENSNIHSFTYVNDRVYILDTQRRWDEMTGTIVRLLSLKADGSDEQVTELYNNLRENPDYVDPDETGTEGGNGADGEIDVMPMPMPRDVVTEEVAEEVPTEDAPVEEPADETAEDGSQTTEDGATVYTDFWINSSIITEAGVYFLADTNSYSIDAMGNYNDLGTELKLYAYGLDGTERYSVSLKGNQDEEYVYYNNMLSDKEGNLVLVNDSKILILDAQGNPLSEQEMDTAEGWMRNAFMGKDGKLCQIWVNNDYTKLTMKQYNLQAKKYEDDVELPENINNYEISAGLEYDLTLTNNQGMYGYNIGDEDVTQIFSYINSDIDGSNMRNIKELGDGRLFATYQEEGEWTQKLAILTHVDPSEIPDKEALTLACYYLDYFMRKRIVAFNKESDKYRIMVKDYSSYSTMEDYKAGVTQLNNDILAGQVPDILILNSDYMSVESYIAKGVLADIGKMIEEDEELNIDDYMQNVFDAYRVDGKLYSVIPSFQITTVMGKTSQVGETPGWTMDDLKALMAKYPEASAFGESMTREGTLWNIMMFSGSTFVDRSTGKCNFDGKQFIDMLEFLAQFPEEFTNDDENYWQNYETQWRENRTLLMSTTINDFRQYARYAQGYFGEPVTLIGFPSEEGIGAVIQSYNQFAIGARSKNKEGAWEFLRYYLTKEYQESDEQNWMMPVMKESLLAKLEEAKERPYWEDEEGNKEYYDDIWYAGNEEIPIKPLTDEEADALFEYISSVNMAYYSDESLNNIIKEEAAPFFAGQKTAEEVAKIIQSRAQVYINESR